MNSLAMRLFPHRRPGQAGAGSPRARFFRDYNRTIGLAYAFLLAGLAAFFSFQLREAVDDEIGLIHREVERHGQFLEFVLRTSADQAEALRMAVAAEGSSRRACRSGRERALSGDLREAGGRFNRDGVEDRDVSGNLVGPGPLAGRSERFYCDLAAVLALDQHLSAQSFHMPHVARTRLLAVSGFRYEHPWRPAAAIGEAGAPAGDPVWDLGQPQANPERLKYWAPTYFGGEDVGLLAPVAAPVYVEDRFIGVVALDMSLDYVARVNGFFGYPLGTVSLVDSQGRVLAHPGLFQDPLAMRAPAPFAQAFAAEALAGPQALAQLPQGVPQVRGDWVVVRRAFISAPWNLVFTVPRAALWRKLLLERGAGMAAVLVALGLLMAVTYRITSRDFVGPAARLVDHVVAESNLQPVPVPAVPENWRPWFSAISRAFRESLQLGSLRKELDIAARLQQSILPRQWPGDPRFTLWGLMRPAKDVGGDFYDHFPVAGARHGLVVADVSGKGISAGLFGMMSKTLMRSLATQRQLSPAGVSAAVNDALCADNDATMFVTTLYAHYEPASGELAYVNAGHPPPLWVRADGSVAWLAATGGAAFGVVPDLAYREAGIRLAPGDLVVVYSDGVTEAMDAAGQEFGRARLAALFEGQPVPAPREAAQRILRAVDAFAGDVEQSDDITCIALRREAAGGAAP